MRAFEFMKPWPASLVMGTRPNTVGRKDTAPRPVGCNQKAEPSSGEPAIGMPGRKKTHLTGQQ